MSNLYRRFAKIVLVLAWTSAVALSVYAWKTDRPFFGEYARHEIVLPNEVREMTSATKGRQGGERTNLVDGPPRPIGERWRRRLRFPGRAFGLGRRRRFVPIGIVLIELVTDGVDEIAPRHLNELDGLLELRRDRERSHRRAVRRCPGDRRGDVLDLRRPGRLEFLRRENRQPPEFDKVKEQLQNYLVRKAQADLITKLRSEGKIERLDAKPNATTPVDPNKK